MTLPTHPPLYRLIDGVVRKWKGSQSVPVRQDFVATVGSGAPDVPRETERLDPTDTGVMASRLLAPFVSEEEEGEYQRSAGLVATRIIPLTRARMNKKNTRFFVKFGF